MRDAVTLQGDSGSRIVFLTTEYCNTPSLPDSEDSQVSNIPIFHLFGPGVNHIYISLI